MFVKILEDRTPEDRCSVCGSDKSVKYYFIDKEGNRKLLCNKCALTYNPVEESSKEHYIVTMTDYRYANGAYIPVESEEMRKALIKEDIYVGSYPDIETATAAIYNKIILILIFLIRLILKFVFILIKIRRCSMCLVKGRFR